jgi:hypothetical protein
MTAGELLQVMSGLGMHANSPPPFAHTSFSGVICSVLLLFMQCLRCLLSKEKGVACCALVATSL